MRSAWRRVPTGSEFGGQFPLARPERDLVVVFNGWNVLPGGKGFRLRNIMTRLVEAVPPIRRHRGVTVTGIRAQVVLSAGMYSMISV
jgi:hypothetical protein